MVRTEHIAKKIGHSIMHLCNFSQLNQLLCLPLSCLFCEYCYCALFLSTFILSELHTIKITVFVDSVEI